ncbi:MAG TPA: universal stress protein [Nitrososphaerales archaeon]|nr:universal stress protein [Nitrososphaerales archaeon]
MAKHKSEINKILVPIDGSETSFNTARHALTMAEERNASIILLYVSDIPPLPLHAEHLEKYYEEVRQEADEWFKKIKNFPESKGVEIKTKVITAAMSVVGSIVKFAEDQDIDLIVIGTRGRSKFTKLLLGSVTSGVTAHATCPVLVVR